jgi:hypothetical protein
MDRELAGRTAVTAGEAGGARPASARRAQLAGCR